MKFESFVLRAATAIDWTLKKDYPDSYTLRCPYVACGMQHLAARAGYAATIAAGAFSCKVFSITDGETWQRTFEASLIEYAHYWTEVEGHLVDPGFRYASLRNTPQTHVAPIAMWPLGKPLPGWMGYHVQKRWSQAVSSILHEEYPGSARGDLDDYLATLTARFDRIGRGMIDSWLLDGRASVARRAGLGDRWARRVMAHERFFLDRRRGLPVRRELVAETPMLAPGPALTLPRPNIIPVAPKGFAWVNYYDAPQVAADPGEIELIERLVPDAVLPDARRMPITGR